MPAQHCQRCQNFCDIVESYGRRWCQSCVKGFTLWPVGNFSAAANEPYNYVGSPRYFGVELEIGDSRHVSGVYDISSFGCKEDGSSGVYRELYSPPMMGNTGFDMIDTTCVFALKNKWHINKGCGYHIHIDLRKSVNYLDDINKIVLGYYLTEDYWFMMVPSSRRSNQYCRTLREYYRFENLCKAMHKPLLKGTFEQSNRYLWASCNSYYKHKTFEIRLHPGTTHPVKVKNWLRVHLRFVDWLLTKSTKDIVDHFGVPWLTEDMVDMHVKMVDIWKDPELGLYYQDRAIRFGNRKLIDWNPSFVEAL